MVDDLERLEELERDPVDNENKQIDEMICDLHQECDWTSRSRRPGITESTDDLQALLDEAKTPLYVGATFLVLRASIEIMNLQTSCGWSNASVDALLTLIGKLLPAPHQLPTMRVEARARMTQLNGLDDNKIHACPNDCVLYRRKFEALKECPM
jgi:hypothetical protein